MKISIVHWVLACSLVGSTAYAAVQDGRGGTDRKPPAERPKDRPPQDREGDKPRDRGDKPDAQKPDRPERPADARPGPLPGAGRIDRALEELEKKAAQGPITKEEVAQLRALVSENGDAATPGNPRAAKLRDRLNGAIADLESRAASAALQKEDLLRLRERVVDMRLDNALAQLEMRARDGQIERADYDRLKTLLAERAELVQRAGDGEAIAAEGQIQQKLNAKIDELAGKASATLEPKEVEALRAPLVERRVERALDHLERNAMSGRASDADVDAVRDAIADRGELAGEGSDAKSIQQRYANVLEGLKQKLIAGSITREEFAQLRAQLTQKAREASSGDK